MKLTWCRVLWLSLALTQAAFGYEVSISDLDDARQICSGMYGGSNAHINSKVATTHHAFTHPRLVSFTSDSRGQVAAVIYEWTDVAFLGKPTSDLDDYPVSVLSLSAIQNAPFLTLRAENLCLHDRCNP